MTNAAPRIHGWHSHVYFDAETLGPARALHAAVAERFPEARMGRIWERPVGPHPDWSFQIAYRPALFGDIMPWLAENRAGLVVFTHPETGDDLRDHRDLPIWMGAIRPLKLAMFERSSPVGGRAADDGAAETGDLGA